MVPDSGLGWQLVQLVEREGGEGAQLMAKRPFDFEDERYKEGVRFQVQVTDQVGWGRLG